jgi:hypothetical protein
MVTFGRLFRAVESGGLSLWWRWDTGWGKVPTSGT